MSSVPCRQRCRRRSSYTKGKREGESRLSLGQSGVTLWHLQDVILQAMYLRAVLVGHNGSLGGARIGAQYDAIGKDDAHNGGAGAHRLGRLVASGQQLAVSAAREGEGED